MIGNLGIGEVSIPGREGEKDCNAHSTPINSISAISRYRGRYTRRDLRELPVRRAILKQISIRFDETRLHPRHPCPSFSDRRGK